MKTKKQLMAWALSFALLFGMIPNAEVSAAKKVSLSTKKLTVTKGKSKTLKVKNTKKKVTWKVVSGKKYITLKKKGKASVTVKGKKKGKAKVQEKIGKKKLTCTVTVKNATTAANTPKPSNKPVSTESTKPAVTTALPVATMKQPPVTTKQPTGTQTPPSTSESTSEPTGSHEEDVAALKAMIEEQRESGATVSEDINSIEYTWQDGRLTGISWPDKNLSGSINTGDLKELTNLDISGCKGVTTLYCSNKQLTSLDVSGCKGLGSLYCMNNQLESLDISDCERLMELHCDNNRLGSLDVSTCENLRYLHCQHNQLGSLDVSNNVNLSTLYCEHNQINSLDLTNITSITSFSCDDTVNVTGCSNIKPATDLNEQDVTALRALIEEQRERGAWVGDNLIYSHEYKWENGRLTEIDWSGKNLSGDLDLSGLENLNKLFCESKYNSSNEFILYDNRLSGLDVSKNMNLTSLSCGSNQLSSLDVSNNVNLRTLNCVQNQLSSLDVSRNVDLEILYCMSNQLSSLDVSNNVKLRRFRCDDTVTVIGLDNEDSEED